MPRKTLIRSGHLPYHVYNRTLESKFYSLERAKLWEIYTDACQILSWFYGARIHAFVLMANHYHLLISTPDQNLDDCMGYFQSFVSREIAKASESKEFRFESRYRWSLIKNAYHYKIVFRYVYQNPLQAGICAHAEAYPWSTLSGVVGSQRLLCPIYPQEVFDAVIAPVESVEFLEWINQAEKVDINLKIQKGLMRSQFNIVDRIRHPQKTGEREGAVVQRCAAPFGEGLLEEGVGGSDERIDYAAFAGGVPAVSNYL